MEPLTITDIGRTEILGVPINVLNAEDYPLLIGLAEELAKYEAEKQKHSGIDARSRIIS